MRSSSADTRGHAGPREPVLGRRTRAVLTALLVGVAVVGPAVGIASARFGAADAVTISITVTRTDPAPGPTTTAPTAGPTTTAPEASGPATTAP
ncbi:MAG: hypothetical protein IE923_03940 [Micrococcales bacterium]|nr:hypothetical protein [Micrococcales bacterium]